MSSRNAKSLKNRAFFTLWVIGCIFLFTAGPGSAEIDLSAALFRASDLQIGVAPALALYGTPFSIRLTGLARGEQVTVTAQSTDQRKILWESSAVFEAGDSGVVDLAVQAPVSGSYSGADIYGLLWSMQPKNPPSQKKIGYREDETYGTVVDFSAADTIGRSASARLERVFELPSRKLVRVALEQDGLRGVMYHPEQGGPFPGVLLLAGSGGGVYEWLTKALASNGFAVLNLAYFNYKDLPRELVEIPVEYFERAVEWMKAQPSVKPDRIGLAGGSKGGELALLLASRFIDFRAVVAWTPGEHVWEGLSLKFFDKDYTPISSWSHKGKPLPYVHFIYLPEEREKEKTGELRSYVAAHDRSLAQGDKDEIAKAVIPAEKIKSPLLLISGTDDQTWPADRFCRNIVAKLKKSGFRYELKHISHTGGGHMSFLPTLITANRGGGVSGGSAPADAKAGFVSWEETLLFLHRHLDR